MPLIHVLDEPTINQIAAGEVVERPSAVVKELIENAMDAGATAVTAEIKEGGLSFIRITDNGSGIAKEDIPLAFLRHATSKIRSAQDLLSITSLGFRGEALSSVAAVAQLELITKTPSAINGYRYIIEGGEEKSIEEIGCPGGTTIIVRNLFYNTPARRKFLKSAQTEAGYISDLMERLMVSHPGVSFKFIVNNQVKLQSSGNNSSKDILYHVYGRDISRELLPVEFNSEYMKITGYIGKPMITRGNRNYENYFINGRYIKSNIITKAIEEAYKPFMMQHKYPFTSLYFEIDPSQIDVNVHPQKMEIRLKNGEEAYQSTLQTLRNVLSNREMIPRVVLTQREEAKKEEIKTPEPFEENRRKLFENQTKDRMNAGSSSLLSGLKSDNRIKQAINTNSFTVNYENGKISDIRVAENKDSYCINQKDENKTAKLPTIASNMNSDSIRETTSGINLMNSDVSAINKADIGKTDEIRKSSAEVNTEKVNIEILNTGIVDTEIVNAESINAQKINTEGVSAEEADTEKEGLDKSDAVKTEFDLTDRDNIVINNNRYNNNPDNDKSDNKYDTDQIEAYKHSSDKIEFQPQIAVGGQMDLFENSNSQTDAPFISKKAFDEHRIIGQIFSTYWLVEYKKELYIIDQHAAHEKVLYEKIMKAAKTKTYESQQLLPPIVLSLTLREQEVIHKQEEILNSLGYEFEYFGGNEFSVRAVPADLYGISEKELLLEFIDDMADDIVGNTSNATSILERVASMSCKAAVKANHTMSNEEAQALIKELLTLDNPYNCPHGRPVIISMSQYELERKFKRII